ncbi:MAG: FdtA/QdtA family cupin domain-containing protein, partial [Muribaculaceae bacterium]|nr:FdtA/QdtA family cupin domain-containing protein [Muribaculaceae bacterium]
MKKLLDGVRIIEFPKICDPRGNLSFVESARHVPFSIKRVFYIYD